MNVIEEENAKDETLHGHSESTIAGGGGAVLEKKKRIYKKRSIDSVQGAAFELVPKKISYVEILRRKEVPPKAKQLR